MNGYITEVKLVFVNRKKPETCESENVTSECTKNEVTYSCPEPVSAACGEISCKPASSSCDPCNEEPSCSKASERSCNACDEKPSCESPCETAPDDKALGKVTRNPFFNFLRVFRKCHKNMSAKELAINGAAEWKTMSEQAKSKYIVQAFHTPKKYYQSKMDSSDDYMDLCM